MLPSSRDRQYLSSTGTSRHQRGVAGTMHSLFLRKKSWRKNYRVPFSLSADTDLKRWSSWPVNQWSTSKFTWVREIPTQRNFTWSWMCWFRVILLLKSSRGFIHKDSAIIMMVPLRGQTSDVATDPVELLPPSYTDRGKAGLCFSITSWTVISPVRKIISLFMNSNKKQLRHSFHVWDDVLTVT